MNDVCIVIVGLGYVGLPLAIEFSKQYQVIGFDVDQERIDDLLRFKDTKELTDEPTLRAALGKRDNTTTGLSFTAVPEDMRNGNIYIVTVPTPVDHNKKPDLTPLLKATETIARVLKKGDLVIYESTVYPGCTEEDCVPVLERISGLKYNEDFFCGYSPERINVGDNVNTLTHIMKVTSGSTPEIAEKVDQLYASIITAGTHKAPSIKVAEASKAIENAQRDLNISFVNELALIFDKMGIDTHDVLDAAGTKWNFLKYKPGLVGGHCIGVDPYYLTFKAGVLGYEPKVISSGRSINEGMGKFVAEKVMTLLKHKKEKSGNKISILVLGIAFKENCSDIRNSGVLQLYKALTEADAKVDLFDPCVDKVQVATEYSIPLVPEIDYMIKYDAVIFAVAHDNFKQIDFERLKESGTLIYDIKGVLDRQLIDARL